MASIGHEVAVRGKQGLEPAWAVGAAAAAIAAVVYASFRIVPGPRNDAATAIWYRRLRKPSATPPAPAFPVAWSALELCLAYGGYRLMTRPAEPSQRGWALGFWAACLAWIPSWARIAFGERNLRFGFAGTIAYWLTAVGYIRAAAKVDRLAAWTGAPLLLWLTFAGYLSEELVRRNPRSA